VSEQVEIMNALRDRNKYRKAARRESQQTTIARILGAYAVKNMNKGFQFRVNDVLDLYPTNCRFHNLRTNKRGSYPAYSETEFLEFVTKQLAQAQETPPRPAHVPLTGGRCKFCFKDTGNPHRYICRDCSKKPVTDLIFKGTK
jgi:hypothetical protein